MPEHIDEVSRAKVPPSYSFSRLAVAQLADLFRLYGERHADLRGTQRGRDLAALGVALPSLAVGAVDGKDVSPVLPLFSRYGCRVSPDEAISIAFNLMIGDLEDGPTIPEGVTVDTVLADPAASFWLKAALKDSVRRDPFDAHRDAAILRHLLAERLDGAVQAARASLLSGGRLGIPASRCA